MLTRRSFVRQLLGAGAAAAWGGCRPSSPPEGAGEDGAARPDAGSSPARDAAPAPSDAGRAPPDTAPVTVDARTGSPDLGAPACYRGVVITPNDLTWTEWPDRVKA